MKKRINFAIMLAVMFILPITLMVACKSGLSSAKQARRGANGALIRPQGSCDIYAAAGDPCLAAHSSARALYAAYNGPLYQIMRQSDGKTMDIGVVQPSGTDAGGYAAAR